jgi:hypothetical protein
LSTLLLLLGVSAGIVLRSIILRRRFRRQVQDAIQVGILQPDGSLPGTTPGKGPFGEKPKIWDVWMDAKPPMAFDDQNHVKPQSGEEECKWLDLMVNTS